MNGSVVCEGGAKEFVETDKEMLIHDMLNCTGFLHSVRCCFCVCVCVCCKFPYLHIPLWTWTYIMVCQPVFQGKQSYSVE